MKTCDYNLDGFTVIGFLLAVLLVATLGGLFSKSPDQRKAALISGFQFVGFFSGLLLLFEVFQGKTFASFAFNLLSPV